MLISRCGNLTQAVRAVVLQRSARYFVTVPFLSTLVVKKNNMRRIQPNPSFSFHTSTLSRFEDDGYSFWSNLVTEEEGEEENTKDEMSDLVNRYLHVPGTAHQVLLIQPFIRKGNTEAKTDTNVDLMLDESKALLETLNWKVVDTVKIGLNSYKKKYLFGSGNLTMLDDKVASELRITAVFISLYRLTGTQRSELENMFKVPVIDRYHLVLLIFQQHAKTREARLQVALAEIPYIRKRLSVDYLVEQGQKHSASRKGETYFQTRKMCLHRLKSRVSTKIEALRGQRKMLRDGRKRLDIPTVAVIGYTNCGKTTLIKSLTGANLQPVNQLFATLDVTCHGATLPDKLQCVFLDTVGFISDIPTGLIASFSSTLEDALHADLLLHVQDVSHPDGPHQVNQVLATLDKLQVSQSALDNMITVGNKIDKIAPSQWKGVKDEGVLPISATEGYGVSVLAEKIEKALIKVTDRKRVRFRVKTGSEEYSWLFKSGAINAVDVDEGDMNFCHVTVTITSQDLNRFKSIFVS